MTIPGRSRVAALRDPGVLAVVPLGLLMVAGFVMLGLSWRGGARTPYVPLQMPWLVSGGVAGLAVIGAALASLHIHLSRRAAAAHRLAMEEFVRDAIAVTDGLQVVRRGRAADRETAG